MVSRIVRTDLVQLGRQQTRPSQRRRKSDGHADDDQLERVAQDEALHLGPAGAERHPDADLARALRGDVGRRRRKGRPPPGPAPGGRTPSTSLPPVARERSTRRPARAAYASTRWRAGCRPTRARDGAWPPRLRGRPRCALRSREDSGRTGPAARTASDGCPRAAGSTSRPRPGRRSPSCRRSVLHTGRSSRGRRAGRSGSAPPRNWLANVWLTIATRAVDARSVSANGRPRSTLIRITSK